MIRHIVAWKFKPDEEEKAKEFIEKLLNLKDVIPQIVDMKAGFNKNNAGFFDAALVLDVANESDLETYKNHPEHKKVSALCKSIRLDRQSVDFEF